MFKKFISVFLVICMLATMIPLTVGASAVDSRDVGDNQYYESEPNDGDIVNLLYSDMTMYGTLAGYDIDCYKIVLTQKSNITFLSTSSSSTVIGGLWNAADECIAAATREYSGGSWYLKMAGSLNAGTYYIKLLRNDYYYSSVSYLFYYECVPVATHTHSYSVSSVTPATPTSQGYTTYSCSCGDSYKADYVDYVPDGSGILGLSKPFLHFDCRVEDWTTAVSNNLKNPHTAWGYTEATLQEYSSDDPQDYMIKLEEMYVGAAADEIVEEENWLNDDPTGNQHWILMKFYIENNSNKKLDATDIVYYYDSFYTRTGASLNIVDIATFSGEREGMGVFDVELYPGASGYVWIGILPQQSIAFPYIKINNGYDSEEYEAKESWLDTQPKHHTKVVNNTLYSFSDGTYKKYTGTYANGNAVKYYSNGLVNNAYNGFGYGVAGTYYFKNGNVVKYNSLVPINGEWYYFTNGKLNTATTLCLYNGDYWYVKNGKVDFKANTLCLYGGQWWHVQGGKVNFKSNNTLVLYNGDYWYVQGGKVNFKANTLCYYNKEWWHVQGGKVNFKSNTLVLYNGDYWYTQGGKVNFKANTLCLYGGQWWHVQGGKVNFKSNTLVLYNGDYWYTQGGKVNFKANTLCYYGGQWWHVQGGKVNFKSNTLCLYNGDYWYTQGGKVNFKANTLCYYGGAWWHVQGGKVNFKSNTRVMYNGKWYTVRGGKVV